jgi:hypothetical protein
MTAVAQWRIVGGIRAQIGSCGDRADAERHRL